MFLFASCGGGEDEILDSPNNPNTPNIVTLTNAGTLKTTLGENYLDYSILKIVGPINGNDIYCLREMMGGGEDESVRANLSTLDLSDAKIVKGGSWYFNEGRGRKLYTSNNIIGCAMFQGCSLLRNIVLPNNVTTIGERAFFACESLTSIEIPNSVITIENDAFFFCTSLASITIPNSVIRIGTNALNACFSLTSIDIPNSVTLIGGWAFSGCSSLSSIEIPNNIKLIGYSTFWGCKSLTSVTIGNNVTSIGDDAFYGCEALAEVTCHATTPPELSFGVFDSDIKETANLYIPKGCLEVYNSSEWRNFFSNIVEMD